MSQVPPSERPGRTYGEPPADRGWRGPSVPQPPPPVAGPAPAGAWAQPPPPGYADPRDPGPGPAYPGPGYAEPGYAEPGYAEPGYADPRYQHQPAWSGPPGSAASPPRRTRRSGPSWVTVAPALFGSLVISIGVLVLFLGDLFVALGAPKGTTGRERLLVFLGPADLAAALAVIVAVALVVLQRRVPGDAAPSIGPPAGRVRSIALVAGAVAAVVAVAALARGLVYLTMPHVSGTAKFGYLIVQLAIAAIAGAATAWGLRNR